MLPWRGVQDAEVGPGATRVPVRGLPSGHGGRWTPLQRFEYWSFMTCFDGKVDL